MPSRIHKLLRLRERQSILDWLEELDHTIPPLLTEGVVRPRHRSPMVRLAQALVVRRLDLGSCGFHALEGWTFRARYCRAKLEQSVRHAPHDLMKAVQLKDEISRPWDEIGTVQRVRPLPEAVAMRTTPRTHDGIDEVLPVSERDLAAQLRCLELAIRRKDAFDPLGRRELEAVLRHMA